MAILYLHGFGSSQRGEKAGFLRQQATSAGITFCSFDFQGHGESGGAIEDLTLSRNLEDVRRVHGVLRARGHRRIVVVGSSLGALTGLWYSALQPEDLIAGVFISPALGLGDGLARWAGDEGLETWRKNGSIEVENELGTWDLRYTFMEDLTAFSDGGLMEAYRTPCLIVQGQQDDRVDWARVQEFVTVCPFRDLEFHLFADGDHRLTDRMERVWDLMLSFLRGRGWLTASRV